MRNFKFVLIAIASLALFAACAKEEKAATTTAEQGSLQRDAEVLPPPEPTKAVPAETEVVPDETSAATETVAETPSSSPAPLLPRRGEEAVPVQPPAADSSAEERHAAAQASQRIKIQDAYEIVRAGNGVLVDVRSAEGHQYQRIPGSLNIPLGEIASRASELPQDKWIILYCTCPAEESSGAAAATLTNMGFERVAALLGGMQGWRAAGLPMEFGQ